MPTFRYKGNLIHFAQFKNHIGIYPGPDAIEKFKNELSTYKTSKGAIQLPNNLPLNKKLIQDIIQFNLQKQINKKEIKRTNYSHQWQTLDQKMYMLLEKTPLKKELKWGMDIYTFQGKNIVGWAGFKHFFSIWFYNGVFLKDPFQVLINASEGKTKGLRQWRIKDPDEFDENKILQYINESIQTVLDGKQILKEKGITLNLKSGILKEHLDKNEALKIAFNQLTPGRQKEYILYIEEAKQEKTKYSRMKKLFP